MLHRLHVKTHSEARDRKSRWFRVLKKKGRHSNFVFVEISIKNRFRISVADRINEQNKAVGLKIRDLNKYHYLTHMGEMRR
jgi:hypothetical protein